VPSGRWLIVVTERRGMLAVVVYGYGWQCAVY